MKEVKLGRYAGPFKEILYEYFIQSPIGLVPKNNGKNTRLIFHLSYPRSGKSVNSETPVAYTTVKYPDFGDAIQRCIEEIQAIELIDAEHSRPIYIRKSDMTSAFKN